MTSVEPWRDSILRARLPPRPAKMGALPTADTSLRSMRRPRTAAPALLALLLPTACLAPHADEARPEMSEMLRGELPESWAQPAGEGAYPADPFWMTFSDPTLEALVQEALVHNHDLIGSAERLRGAVSRARIARAARRPQLDANTSYLRQKNIFVGLPFPGSSGVLSNQFSQWSAGLDLAWELDVWGKLGAGVTAAKADAAATFADFQGARLSIAAQVTNAWFALREADEQLSLARETVETYRRSLQVVDDRFSAGLSGALDLKLAQANVATSQANISSSMRAKSAASRQIEILLGRFPSAELALEGPFGELPPPVPAGIPADVLGRRPDLVAAERRMAAAEALAKQARLDRWPNLALTGSVGRTSDEFDDLLDGDFSVWSIAGRLAGPILDGGRRRARVEEALSDLRAARAAFAGLALRAFFEVENALDAELRLRERMGHLSNAARAAREATGLAEDQYREGLVSIELVLEAQRRHLVAESAFLSARRELFQSRVDLHVALGGSFATSEGAQSATQSGAAE